MRYLDPALVPIPSAPYPHSKTTMVLPEALTFGPLNAILALRSWSLCLRSSEATARAALSTTRFCAAPLTACHRSRYCGGSVRCSWRSPATRCSACTAPRCSASHASGAAKRSSRKTTRSFSLRLLSGRTTWRHHRARHRRRRAHLSSSSRLLLEFWGNYAVQSRYRRRRSHLYLHRSLACKTDSRASMLHWITYSPYT